MMYVQQAAARVGYMIPRNNNMTIGDTVELYAAVKLLFKYESLRKKHKRCYDDIVWKTVFNIVVKHQGRFADDLSN